MATPLWRRFGLVCTAYLLFAGVATPAHADEIWVAPTSQADIGGLGVASNTFWPVTPAGAVRLAWAIPDNLQTPQSARVAIIPGGTAVGPALHFYVCAAQNGDQVVSPTNCAGPFVQTFTSVPNQLVEVEISGVLSPRIGTPGSNYLAILAYTTPATATDHILGLRFSYGPKTPIGVATLAANTFTGTQSAPAFAGDGAGLTNVAKLAANTFAGTQTAPAFVGDGSGLTNLPFPAGAATLGANTFGGTQTINTGNIALGNSTPSSGNITKNGALFLHNYGTNNTFLGVDAGNFTLTGGQNTATGLGALHSNSDGSFNTAAGHWALFSNTSGSSNTAIGQLALLVNTTGSNNTATGQVALRSNTTGEGNTANGQQSLYANTAGSFNTASGLQALLNNTTGSFNTANGKSALEKNTTGFTNTADGNDALYSNTTGIENTATGHRSLYLNTTGSDNTAIGLNALWSNVSGDVNTAIGVWALLNNTTGSANTAVGEGALIDNGTGSNNTAVGFLASVAPGDGTGSNNTALGSRTIVSAGKSNATAIGANAIVNASNKIRLGDSAVTVIEGQVAYTFTSDKTKKENFQRVNAKDILRKLATLDVPSWNYIGHDANAFRHYGPMAQDFFAAFGNDGTGTVGTPTAINSGDQAGILMLAVQALEAENRRLQQDLQDLRSAVDDLKVALTTGGASR